MYKSKIESACELIEAEEFALTWTLVAEPTRADGKLENLLHRIALAPESFPVVVWPNTRMALLIDEDGSVGVFFRILANSQQIELLRSLVKKV
ncbi:MAG: hypothetical protein L0Z50_39225 [Verrucomicrobiales bacterium]|nr:hypothetical protein [Verrucomicrobiales bacterium]